MTDHRWMKDPLLSDIPLSKLEFMQKLVFDLYKLSEKERLPFLLALAGKVNKEKISFTEDETRRIILVLKEHRTPEEVQKMDRILRMLHSKAPQDADITNYDDVI